VSDMILKVTRTDDYLIPAHIAADYPTTADLITWWFEKPGLHSYHATRDHYRIGNSAELVQVTDESGNIVFPEYVSPPQANVLTAYALRDALNRQGHNVNLIDAQQLADLVLRQEAARTE